MVYAKKKHLTIKNYITKVVLAGITIFLLSFCRQAHALTWSPPQAIAGEGAADIDMTVDPNNNWHVVYRTSSSSGNIRTFYIKYVSSTGARGIIAQGIYYGDINAGESVSHPTIDADSNGRLHVIYQHSSYPPLTQTLMYTNNLSGPWSPP